MKTYRKQAPMTVYDVLKQRDQARAEREALRVERDQLRQLCQIAANYLRYLPLRPEEQDAEIIQRLEAAAKGDTDVAANPQATPQEWPGGRGPASLRAPAGQAEAPAPSVQGDRDDPPAPDPGESGSTPQVTLTTVEKKVLKALRDPERIAASVATYDLLATATGVKRHQVISAVHTLARYGLVERAEGGWRRV